MLMSQSFDDVFDVDHPVFSWIFRASRCWQAISDVLPSMRAHIRSTLPSSTRRQSIIPEHRSGSGMRSASDYSTLFRELFCVAAKDLADQIQEPLKNIGVLFGDIMRTGTLSKTAKLKLKGRRLTRSDLDFAEKGQYLPILFGRGQVLFLVRQATAADCSRLQAVGHRFASISIVVEHMAHRMEVTRGELYPQLEKMRVATRGENCLEPGVHFAYFALRPRWHRGFDVLVPNDANYLLPTKFLTKAKLLPWQLDLLKQMDNFTLVDCCECLRESRSVLDDLEYKFANELLEGMTQLFEAIGDNFLREARLIARPIQAVCSHDSCSKHNIVFLITFRTIVDAHQYSELNAHYAFTPFKFFRCQQHAFRDIPDNVIFSRKIHREFSALAMPEEAHKRSTQTYRRSRNVSCDTTISPEEGTSSAPSPPRKKHLSLWKWYEAFDVRDDDSSEKNLVHLDQVQPYGGIQVSNEIEVDVCEAEQSRLASTVVLNDFGLRSEATASEIEAGTFADELFALTVEGKRKQPAQQC